MTPSITPRLVHFNRLPQPVRERFVDCVSGVAGGSSTPILSDRLGRAGAVTGYLCLSLVCAVVGVWFVRAGYGDLYSKSGVQGPGHLVAYVAAFFGAAAFALAAVKRVRLLRALPFSPGRYLFALDFVDARSERLRLVAMSSLIDFRGVHHHTNGAYTHTDLTFRFEGGIVETFTVRSRDQAELALTELKAYQARVRQAVEERDAATLWAFDPFLEARLEDTWEEPAKPFQQVQAPLAKPLPALLSRYALVSAVAAVAASVPTWFVRNGRSDEAMFERAVKSRDESMLQRYVDHGRAHVDEVRVDQLPRAALAGAKRQATVSALRAFLAKYPKSVVDAEAREAIHGLFAKTVADFERQASSDNAAVRPFMGRLLAYLEAHDSPPVHVRFATPTASSLAAVDALLAKLSKEEIAPIAGHFGEASSTPRERAIVGVLGKAFSSIFPADVLSLTDGKAPATVARALEPARTPTPDSPTFEIAYDVKWSGSIYESEKRARKFVGIQISFDVAMKIPGDTEPLALALVVEPPDHFSVETTSFSGLGDVDLLGTKAGEPSDGLVYDVMALRAFDQLSSTLRGAFFRPGTAAFESPREAEPSPVRRPPGRRGDRL